MKGDLWIESTTDVDEVLEFVEQRVQNPHYEKDGGQNIVWNFSSHELKKDKLKLGYRDEDKFIIPYQVTSVWAFMYSLLPEELRTAEILIWREYNEQYVAYQQFYRQMSPERREQFKFALAEKLDSIDTSL